MTSRERVIKAITFDKPDRVPVSCWLSPLLYEKYGAKLAEIQSRYPDDMFSPINELVQEQLSQQGEYTDEWNCVWENLGAGGIGIVRVHPIQNYDQLRDYTVPDPFTHPLYDILVNAAKALILEHRGEERFVIGVHLPYFERLQWLRGYENLMIDLIEQPEGLGILMQKVLDYNMRAIEMILDEFGNEIDAIGLQDDWGTQTQLMINPKIWRDLFKPAYERMIAIIKEADKFVDFHSDGYVIDIIPDLIEVGVDVLNVQLPAMGMETLSKQFRGLVCFRSDLDRQHTLPRGTTGEVREHVKNVIRSFATSDGGLIGGADVGIDVPLENVETIYKTFYEYGRYPLQI